MPDPKNEIEESRFMNSVTRIWLWLGGRFGVRPATIIGLTVGAIVFAGALGYTLATTEGNSSDIGKIQSALCGGTAPYDKTTEARCRVLLDRLLKNPTPEQRERLKRIVQQ